MTLPPGNPRLSRILEGIALLLLVASALLFQRSATATWVEGRAGDGRRLQVSPIGVTDFGLGTTGTPSTECRWWPKLGNEELCAVAPDGAMPMTWLRRAYPLVVIAMWTAVLALFLNALRIPRQAQSVGVFVTMVIPAMGLLALWSVGSLSSRALAVLAGLALQPVMPGFAIVAAATGFTAAAGLLLVLSRRFRRD